MHTVVNRTLHIVYMHSLSTSTCNTCHSFSPLGKMTACCIQADWSERVYNLREREPYTGGYSTCECSVAIPVSMLEYSTCES